MATLAADRPGLAACGACGPCSSGGCGSSCRRASTATSQAAAPCVAITRGILCSSTDGYQTLTEVAAAEGTQEPERASVERLVADADERGCRGWRGSFEKDGYPRAWWQGRYVRAARLLYTWQRGEIPKGWTLDHTCVGTGV
jgi:hypothetical protein